MRAARTSSLTPPRIGTCSLDDHRPQLLRAPAQRGVDAQVSWGWLFKGGGIENCTGGIEGLSQCAGTTGAVQGTFVEHSGLALARGEQQRESRSFPREPCATSPQVARDAIYYRNLLRPSAPGSKCQGAGTGVP
jgi:hypothetical protein